MDVGLESEKFKDGHEMEQTRAKPSRACGTLTREAIFYRVFARGVRRKCKVECFSFLREILPTSPSIFHHDRFNFKWKIIDALNRHNFVKENETSKRVKVFNSFLSPRDISTM